MSEDQEQQAKNEAAIQQKLAAIFAANKDEVSIPKIYIDITGDIEAAAVLDELMFWTLPKKGTGKTSLRVFKKGALWLAVRRRDWWDRKRLTERQADSAIAKLVKMELVEKEVFLFDGKPTVHLRMNMTKFTRLYSEKMQEIASQEEDQNLIRDIADLYQMMGFPNETVNSILQNGEMLNLQNGEFINSLQQPENTTIGADAPNLPLEWQIAQEKPIVRQDSFDAQIRDVANRMDMNCLGAGAIAYEFMKARKIVIPDSKIKGNRRAAREMLEMHVKPEHVLEAVKSLTEKGMTVTDLFSISKTAIDLANKPDLRNQNGRDRAGMMRTL